MTEHDAGRTENIAVLYEQARQEADDAKKALAEAQQRATAAEKRVRLMAELLSLDSALEAPTMLGESPPKGRPDFLDAAVEVLKERGGSMGVRELKSALLSIGVPLPGKGEDANLISRFLRSQGRIRKVSPGVYDIRREGVSARLALPDGSAPPLTDRTIVGHGPGADVTLNDARVSSTHATIARKGERYTIRDDESTNGTWLNGARLEGIGELANGDRIEMGDTELRFWFADGESQ
jgi:hypothetical protein